MRNKRGTKAVAKSDLPSKICITCGRPFNWRKKWEKCWDDVKYCSDRCRRSRGAGQTAQAVASSDRQLGLFAPDKKTEAAEPDQHRHDLGNVVHFEHVNLEVPDVNLARIFYAEGLGLTPDPGATARQRGGANVQWYNIGRQQFHISKGSKAQRTPLPLGIVMPTLDGLKQQLDWVAPFLKETEFDYTEHSGGLLVTDPWGQEFDVQEAGDADFPASMGIQQVWLPCHDGTAAAIGDTYAFLLKARTEQLDEGVVAVYLGPGTTLVFDETTEVDMGGLDSQQAAHSYSGWHIAFYIADFSGSYHAIDAAGVNLLDHPYGDKAPSIEKALQYSQFRWQDITAQKDYCDDNGEVSIKEGQLLHRLGHEIRSLYHSRFMRALYNKGSNVYDDAGCNQV